MANKNLIWIVLDSIRADHTEFGGYARETMPFTKNLANSSEGFGGTAIAHSIWSLPSVASMMTGLYPSRHGLGMYNEVLPPSVQTVAERLSQAGYHTIGLSTNPYFSETKGLDRGFDEFSYYGVKDLARESGLSKCLSFARYSRRYSAGISLDKRKHSPDYLLNEVVKDTLSSLTASSQPFSVVAHYYGVHHPYYPSPHFQGLFNTPNTNTEEVAEKAFELSKNIYKTIAEVESITEKEWEELQIAYDSLIRQVDDLIGGLLSHINDIGLTDNSIIVITSDHGDLLGEYGLLSHKLVLHDALLQTPIAIYGSDRMKDFSGGLFQHIDIMQTILEELSISTEGMHGVTLPEESREFTISQRGQEASAGENDGEKTIDRIKSYNPEYELDQFYSEQLTALRTTEWKLIQGDDCILYNLPNEKHDVSDANPAITEELASKLSKWIDKYGQPIQSQETAEFSERVKDRLKDLGYMDG